MKAILLSGHIDADGLPRLMLYADSAIGRDVMPLFVPDVPVRLEAWMCPAFRIGRLGKDIRPKFANRYIEAVSVVAVLAPARDTGIDAAFDTPTCVGMLDSAITTGRWIDYDPERDIYNICVGDVQVTVCPATLQMPQLLAAVSRVGTLKTGDILIHAGAAVPVGLDIGSTTVVTIDACTCLTLRVK